MPKGEEKTAAASAHHPRKFSELSSPRLHPLLLKGVERNLGFDRTTEIQDRTWQHAANGCDVIGRARTGTGKSLSFLLPAAQMILGDRDRDAVVHALVLCPTRELAAQIGEQARLLLGAEKEVLSHQVVYGGTSKPRDVKQFERRVPSILVATPGRLLDHLQTTNVGKVSFAQILSRTSILVLDETDRLLDMGFRREVDQIISYLPSKQHRQTLLFSATIPPEVREVTAAVMKSKHVIVDCIHDHDPTSHTNAQVEQNHVIISSKDRLVTGTVDILCRLIRDAKASGEPLKLVAFFNTANLVAYYAQLFNVGLGIEVLELHSRKTQSFRTRTAERFRAADSAILFTSDVSARGVDYPDVTHVVQFGIADSRESYIHRLGRTGRASKLGEGLLVLTELEQNFLRSLKGLSVPVHAEMQALVGGPPSPAMASKLDPIFESMGRHGGQNAGLASSARSAYRSMLGFYNGKLAKLGVKGSGPLVDFVNGFAMQTGLTEIPELEQKTVKKMGLSGVEGLNIVKNGTARNNNNNNNGGGGRGRGGKGGDQQGRGGRDHQRQQLGGSRRDSSGSPMKRNNSVASDMEESPPNPKKAKPQGGGRGPNNGSGGGGRGGRGRRRKNNSQKKTAAEK